MNVIWEGTVGYLANLQVGESVRFTCASERPGRGERWVVVQRGDDVIWHRLNVNTQLATAAAGELDIITGLVEGFCAFVALKMRSEGCFTNLHGDVLPGASEAGMQLCPMGSVMEPLEELEGAEGWIVHFEVVKAIG